MSEDANNDRAKLQPSLSGEPEDGGVKKTDYEIGYRKPPKATQFKKGQSGNPKGAKKKPGIEDVRIMVESIAAEPVPLRDGGRTVTVSLLEAALRGQRMNALKGDHKAAKLMFKLAQKGSHFSKAKPKSNMILDEPGSTPEERMIIRAYQDELDGSNEGNGRVERHKQENDRS